MQSVRIARTRPINCNMATSMNLRKDIDTGPIWDLLFYGHGMRGVEKMNRKRNGSLMAVVIDALEV